MHLVIDQRVEALACISIKFTVDRGDQIGFRPQHRLSRHPFDHADAGDHDATRAQFVQQPVEQNAPVHNGHGFGFQPCDHHRAGRPAQVSKTKARLDGGELIVTGRRTPREVGNDGRVYPDLLGNVVEHDRRQQLACAQVPPRIAQAAELQSVA